MNTKDRNNLTIVSFIIFLVIVLCGSFLSNLENFSFKAISAILIISLTFIFCKIWTKNIKEENINGLMGPIFFCIIITYSTSNLLYSFENSLIAQTILTVLFLSTLIYFFIQSIHANMDLLDKFVAIILPLFSVGGTIADLGVVSLGYFLFASASILIIHFAFFDKKTKNTSDEKGSKGFLISLLTSITLFLVSKKIGLEGNLESLILGISLFLPLTVGIALIFRKQAKIFLTSVIISLSLFVSNIYFVSNQTLSEVLGFLILALPFFTLTITYLLDGRGKPIDKNKEKISEEKNSLETK